MSNTDRAAVITGLHALADALAEQPDLALPHGFDERISVYVYSDTAFFAWREALGDPPIIPRTAPTSPYTARMVGSLAGLPIEVNINTERVGERRVVGMVEQVAWAPPPTGDDLDRAAARDINAAVSTDASAA